MGRISRWEVEELAAYIVCDNDETAADEMLEDEESIEQAVYDRYEVEFEQFSSIIEDIIKYTPTLDSVVTETRFHVFGIQEENHFRAIVKQEVE